MVLGRVSCEYLFSTVTMLAEDAFFDDSVPYLMKGFVLLGVDPEPWAKNLLWQTKLGRRGGWRTAIWDLFRIWVNCRNDFLEAFNEIMVNLLEFIYRMRCEVFKVLEENIPKFIFNKPFFRVIPQ